jgi:hypothetical protein
MASRRNSSQGRIQLVPPGMGRTAAPGSGSGSGSDAWDVWDAWLVAQAEVEIAYREWASAPPRQREERYIRYRAALEREDRAAAVLSATAHAVSIAA